MAGTGSVSLTLLHWIVAALALLGDPSPPRTDCPCATDLVREAHETCVTPPSATDGSDATAAPATVRGG